MNLVNSAEIYDFRKKYSINNDLFYYIFLKYQTISLILMKINMKIQKPSQNFFIQSSKI